MATSKPLTQTKLEQLICQISYPEGVGTLYERVVLSRFFNRLVKKHQIKSSVEYYTTITKGWDSLTLSNSLDQVTIADSNYQKMKKLWPTDRFTPKFSNLRDAPQADLVWNFAIIHHNPGIIKRMAQKSNRFVLVFTPNFLNWGWPLHAAFHTLTRTPCNHPESGNRWRRTLFGLKSFLQSSSLHPVETGYIDMPIWPDFAFSKAELAKAFGKTPRQSKQQKPNPQKLRKQMDQHTHYIEEKPFSKFVAPVIAHHQYVLAQK